MLPLLPLAPVLPQSPSVTVGPFAQLIASRYTVQHGLPTGPITAILFDGDAPVAVSDAGAARFDGTRWVAVNAPAMPSTPKGLPDGARITGQAKAKGALWVSTTKGTFTGQEGAWRPLLLPRTYKVGQPVPHIDSEIRHVQRDAAGTVWLATSHGALLTDGADWWQPMDRTDGMPYEDMLCVAMAPNGDVWGGTTQGAWRLRAGTWRYFAGKRWLPGDRVNAIAFDRDGGVWLATNAGVARIAETPIRLADKARHYEAIVRARHVRRGFVTSCGLKTPGDPSGGHIPEASDNDGLWTALYIAAQSFRYAVTKEPEARAFAKESMEALLDLVRLSGYPGFPARAIVRQDEVGVTGINLEETVRVEGETDRIWYKSPTHPDVLCKGDTSSDELDGHYFAWFIYHELVADADEKREIARIVAAVTDNLLRNEYTLVGHTGRKTRWGVFGPQYLNEDPQWLDERGLNSTELLCYLKVAHHICGDERYRKAYEALIADHHYLINTLHYRRNAPWYLINHSDDELAYCVYYPLLMLEREPAHRSVLLQAIGQTWNGGAVSPGIRLERSPFYNFIYGAVSGEPCLAGEAVETLQDWPWELINWECRNLQRHDVTRRSHLGVARVQIDRVLPASERRLIRWNGNPWQPDGGNPAEEEDAAAWLLPYWMGRYHGFIVEK